MRHMASWSAILVVAANKHARARLNEVHDIYHWYAHELPKLHERFLAERPEAGARVTRR